jgi:hypothetical protein
MPGVIRPYTLVDVLATINGQGAAAGSSTSVGVSAAGFGVVAEVDDAVPGVSMADAATATAAPPASWDQGTWGGVQWS